MRFLNELTSEQIQTLISAIGIPWEKYKANPEGWINFDDTDLIGYPANSTIGVNILNGGVQDHYLLAINEGSGDILKLKAAIETDSTISEVDDDDVNAAIRWAKEVLGIPNRPQTPELPKDYQFACDFFSAREVDFAKVPMEIMNSNLAPAEKIVWIALHYRAGKKPNCWPSARKLAKDTGSSTRTVQRALKKLNKYGLIIKQPRGVKKATLKYPLITNTETINENIRQVDVSGCGTSDVSAVVDLSYAHTSSCRTEPDKVEPDKLNPINFEPDKESDGLNADVQPHHHLFYSEAKQIDPAYKPIFQQIRENRLSRLSAKTQSKLWGRASDSDKNFNGNAASGG